MELLILKKNIQNLKLLSLILFLFIKASSFSQFKKINIYAKDSLQNTILQTINTKPNVDYKTNLKIINNNLTEFGFLNYQIIKKKENDTLVNVEYSLNEQIEMFRIQIAKNKLLATYLESTNIPILSNQVYIPYKNISRFLKNLVAFYETKGHSFTKAKLTNITFQKNYALASIEITLSKARKIDKVIVEGYPKFPRKFIDNYMVIRSLTVFNKKTINQISDKIKALSFVSEIKKPQVLFLKDTTLLYIYLKKVRANQFDGVIGMSTDEESKIKMNGHLNLSLQNIFHKGEAFYLRWKSTSKENKRLEIGITIPYVFNTHFSPKYIFSIFSMDSSYVNIKSQLTIKYPLNRRSSIGVIMHHKQSTNLLKKESTSIMDYKLLTYGIKYRYNATKSINEVAKPYASIEYSYGNLKTMDNNIPKNYIKFFGSYTYLINSKKFIRINNITSMLLTKNYLNNELDLIGGNNSIKGFKEHSIPASKYSLFQCNYHYVVGNKASIYTITDYAYVQNDFLKTTNSLYSVGVGYTTKLKASIININYSLGITDKQGVQANNAMLNISFVNKF